MYYLKRKPKTQKRSPVKSNLSTLVRKLDGVFSEYIRLRDSRQFGYRAFRCISCGQIKPYEKADCGHFISRKHMSTRFDENNCHAECSYCNRFSADHLIAYQNNLKRLLGEDKYNLLIARGHMTKKWSSYELEILIKHYTYLVNEMKKEKKGFK